MVGWGEQLRNELQEVAADRPTRASTWNGVAACLVLVAVVALGGVAGAVWRPDAGPVARFSARAAAPPVVAVDDRPAAAPVVAAPAAGAAAEAVAPVSQAVLVAAGASGAGVGIRLPEGASVALLGVVGAALPPAQACHAGLLAEVLASELPAGTEVVVEEDPSDTTGRYITRVSDGALVNEVVLAAGAAPFSGGALRHHDRLAGAAAAAAASGRGVWDPCPTAVPPGIDVRRPHPSPPVTVGTVTP